MPQLDNKMGDENDIKEDPNFNPMRLEKFQDRKYCEDLKAPELYDLAMSKFKQQNMDAWRPIPTLFYSVGIFVAIILICLTFGIALLGTFPFIFP